MTFLVVETYVLKPDKPAEAYALHKKFKAWMKEHPELFKDVKSHRLYGHMLGGNVGGRVETWELESLADVEKFYNKMMENKEFRTKIYPEFMALTVPGTYSMNVWASIR